MAAEGTQDPWRGHGGLTGQSPGSRQVPNDSGLERRLASRARTRRLHPAGIGRGSPARTQREGRRLRSSWVRAGTRAGHGNRMHRRQGGNAHAEAGRVDRQSVQHEDGCGGDRQTPQDHDQGKRRTFSHLCSAYRQWGGRILSAISYNSEQE